MCIIFTFTSILCMYFVICVSTTCFKCISLCNARPQCKSVFVTVWVLNRVEIKYIYLSIYLSNMPAILTKLAGKTYIINQIYSNSFKLILEQSIFQMSHSNLNLEHTFTQTSIRFNFCSVKCIFRRSNSPSVQQIFFLTSH